MCSERIVRREERDLDCARVAATGIKGLWIEARGELAGGAHLERPGNREQDLGAVCDG